MPDDERPDRRFAMIALEMVTEPELSVIEVDTTPRLLVSGGSITCPRCRLGAFKPALDSKQRPAVIPSVVCLGCPDTPWYPLPDGVVLETNRYRCNSCGQQSQVTMTLSDVNLQCYSCKQLRLHTKQAASVPLRGRPSGYDSVVPEARRRSSLIEFLDDPAIVAADRELVRDWRTAQALAPLSTRMGAALGLEDFSGFSDRMLRKHVAQGLKSPERRTGRTTRGLVGAIAECNSDRIDQLWVKGHTSTYSKDLRRIALEMIGRLGLNRPSSVMCEPLPPGSGALGVKIYVDHYRGPTRAAELPKACVYSQGILIGFASGLKSTLQRELRAFGLRVDAPAVVSFKFLLNDPRGRLSVGTDISLLMYPPSADTDTKINAVVARVERTNDGFFRIEAETERLG